MRSLLLKGSSRGALTKTGQSPVQMIKENLDPDMTRDLTAMLEEPVYIECFMRRVPLKPIRQNHKTQILFIVFFLTVLAGQFILVLPK